MMTLFSTMSDDVHFIGIWGMPGIGKTTLAHAIYDRICHQFEAGSFIRDVRETAEKHGLVHLQKQLLSEILKGKDVNVWPHHEHEGIKVIKKRLPNKKVLIVIDDVDKDEQLQALAGSPSWFGSGSRIIITSKDRQLLKSHVGTIHKATGLENDEALELFSRKAFHQTYPKTDFVGLSNEFVKYAKGLPLALKVLGSCLFDRGREEWVDYLHQLEEIPEEKIMDKLEISYRGLKGIEQKLFLHIACLFRGEDENRVKHLVGVGYAMNLATLKDRSLVTILGGKLWMHDLLQEMAWRIVHNESCQEPGRRSRLWLCKDVFHVLKENTGTESVEGMVLNRPPHKEENLNSKAFSNMKGLRFIKICNVQLPEGLNFLSNELRMMDWHDYPLKFLPMSFQPDNIVELIMPRSHIEQLPEGFGNLAKLRLLDLRDSKVLVKTPSKINLESLEIFILSGCSSLKKFSEIGTNMTRLSELCLDGTAVEELPSSLEHLTGLTVLSLQGCKNLSSFPSVNLPSLKTLNLSGFKVQQPKPSWLLHGFSVVGVAHAFFQGFFPIREAINLLLPRFLGDRNLRDRGLLDLRDTITLLPSISDRPRLEHPNLYGCLNLQSISHRSLPKLPLSVGSRLRSSL